MEENQNPYASPAEGVLAAGAGPGEPRGPAGLLGPPIKVQGVLAIEDYIGALALVAPKGQLRLRIGFVGVAVVALGLIAWIAVSPRVVVHPLVVVFLLFVVLMAPTALLNWSLRRRMLRKQWRQRRGAFQDMETSVTDDGIERRFEVGEVRYLWSAFGAHRRSDRVLILYCSHEDVVHCFARALFQGDDDWERFVRFVEYRFPAK
jgi:hypothetical protein